MSSKPEQKVVTLFGNVGKDPEIRQIPGKEVERWVYDEVVDDVVLKLETLPERELRTFSIAINRRDPKTGEELETRWKYCEDWKGHCARNLVRQGDRVQVRGYFRERSFETESGERKTYQNFQVLELRVLRRKQAPAVA
jgi:single-stranded DNA-binding protein